MARIFTLTVSFEGKDRTALVNLSNEGNDMTFQVHYFDRELYTILPGGHLVFSLSEGLRHPAELDSEGAVRLVGSTVDALSAFFSRSKETDR